LNISFQAPQVISYKCKVCGDCCANNYEKPLSENEKEKLQELYPACSFFEPGNSAAYKLGLQSNGCYFLEVDGSCRIHNEHGMENKPLHCRRFPYSFQRLDDKVYIGYSFACRHLQPFPGEPDNMPWEKLYELYQEKERILPSSINIFSGKKIPAELYLQMENYFFIFLKTREFSLDFPTRLIGLHVFFSMLKQFIGIKENKKRPFDENCALFLSGLGQTNFQTVIDSAQKLRNSEKKRYRRYWWFICDYLHSIAHYRTLSKSRRLFAVYRQLFRSASQFKQYQNIPIQPDWDHPLFRSYFIHLWERKSFLQPSVDVATMVKYSLILTGVIALRYKHLFENNKDVSPDEALRSSLKFIELHYGYHVPEQHKIIQNKRLKKYLALLDKSPLSVSSLFHL